MPLRTNRVWPEIADFERELTVQEVKSLVADPDVRAVQTSSPASEKTWDLLNNEFAPYRPDVTLRVYGFYRDVCDLSFTRRLGNVRRFTADRLLDAVNVADVTSMQNLESLDIGIYSLQGFDFLRDLNPSLKALGLASTRSRRPRIDLISRFQNLTDLYLEGQYRGIEVVSDLKSLEKIALRSISTDGLEYLAPLQRLLSLELKLGGIRNLSAITEKKTSDT